jgi:hypothetical protein
MADLSLEQLVQIGSNPKLSVPSLNLRQQIQEAQAVMEDTSTPAQRANKSAERNRAAVALGRANKDMASRPYGVSSYAAESVAGTGPEAKDFALLAKSNPEQATSEVDAYERAYGMGTPAPSAPDSDKFFKGTMAAPSDGAEIPYYTNLAPNMRDTRARDVQPITPGREGTGGFVSGENAAGQDAMDPRKMEVAQRIRAARSEIAYGPKSEDVTTKEAVRRLPGFVEDIKTLGLEGASAKNLSAIESGELSTDVMNKMLGLATVEVQQQDESEYAKTRESYIDTAMEKGVLYAKRVLQEDRKNAKGDSPRHLLRIEEELGQRGKSKAELDAAAINPADGEFLPLTENDVSAFRGGTTAPLVSGKVDTSAPPTVANPHDGPTTLAQSAANADATIQKLIGTVKLPELVGTAARAPSSYTSGMDKASARIRAASQPAGEYTPQGGFNVEDLQTWIAGGGNMERGRKNRAIRIGRRMGRE